MTTGITTYSDISAYVSSLYDRSLFVAREANLMTQLVRQFSATGWMSRVLTTRPSLSAQSVGEGEDYSSPEVFGKSAQATLTPGEVIAQVIITDRDLESDPDNVRTDAALELGNAIATKIDTDLVSCFTSFTKDVGPGAGSSATIAKFAAGVAILRNAKVPTPINVVLHPYHWHDIWVQLGQPAGTYAFLGEVANQAMKDYAVTNMLQMRWFVSANIPVDTNADAVSGIFSAQAIGFDTRRAPRLEAERDASLRAWEFNMTAGYAYGVIRNTYGVKFTADATEPT